MVGETVETFVPWCGRDDSVELVERAVDVHVRHCPVSRTREDHGTAQAMRAAIPAADRGRMATAAARLLIDLEVWIVTRARWLSATLCSRLPDAQHLVGKPGSSRARRQGLRRTH